jgi:hypothetical protein
LSDKADKALDLQRVLERILSPFQLAAICGDELPAHGTRAEPDDALDFAHGGHGNAFGFARAGFHGFTSFSLPGAAAGHFWRGGGTAGATERARDFGGKATRERSSHASKSWRR